MAETTVPHWTIGAALALFGTAVAAAPMGEATHNAGTVGGRERTFIEYVPKTLKPGAPLLFVLHPSGGDGSDMRDYSRYEFDELACELCGGFGYPRFDNQQLFLERGVFDIVIEAPSA